MRYDARPRFQFFKKLGAELEIQFWQEIQGDQGRRADVGRKEVLFVELHPVGDAGFFRVFETFADPVRIDVYADTAGAEPLRGQDEKTSISATEAGAGMSINISIRVDVRGLGEGNGENAKKSS